MELQLQNKVTAGKVNEGDVADDNVTVKIIMVLYNNAFFILLLKCGTLVFLHRCKGTTLHVLFYN